MMKKMKILFVAILCVFTLLCSWYLPQNFFNFVSHTNFKPKKPNFEPKSDLKVPSDGTELQKFVSHTNFKPKKPNFQPKSDLKVPNNRTELRPDRNNKTILILLYTTLHGNQIWHGLQGDRMHSHCKDAGYHNQNCRVTYDKDSIATADAVLFHARDVEINRNGKYSAAELLSVRNHAPTHQIWIFLSHENPQPDVNIYSPYKQVFNWTATFSRKSDVFIPYGMYEKSRDFNQSIKNYAHGKTGLVAWAASNCQLRRREYVQELQSYIAVTVYGQCRHYFVRQRDCVHNDEACSNELAGYKFFLAFENDFCYDYVTEKYWERIDQGSVPVVMGAMYNDGLVIPGSYIDASKFNSIKALADYLLYLDGNDTAYNEYFAWKLHYKSSNHFIEPFLYLDCIMCMQLNTKKAHETKIIDISEVFNYKNTCSELFQYKVDQLSQQIKNSIDRTTLSPRVWRGLFILLLSLCSSCCWYFFLTSFPSRIILM